VKYTVVDMFCSAGVSARGLIAAGAVVTGVDIKPQPRYPGGVLVGDVQDPETTELLRLLCAEADFIWASPPCQFGTALRHAPGAKKHKNLIPWTRDFLKSTGKPYVIENVEGAREHLRDPVCLCGSMFGLGVRIGGRWYQLERHRYFETSWPYKPPGECNHYGATIGVYGAHARIRAASVPGGRGTSWPFPTFPQRVAAERAMGVGGEGLTLAEMSQGVPPAYARHLFNSWKRHAARAA
jgi:DNA (cytosine-5)-methyltransferase 1